MDYFSVVYWSSEAGQVDTQMLIKMEKCQGNVVVKD